MKKIFTVLLLVILILSTVVMTGCDQREADDVSYNLSQEADNFNIVRQLTVINVRTDTVLFQMTGKVSIETDNNDGQLEVVVEDENGTYHKHFIRLNQWVAYVVEDQGGADVSKYAYQLNFNPQMWIPADVVVSD